MTLERARQLIELACSTTHEEEARTAALAAARLIKKNGYELSETKPTGVPSWERTPPRPPSWAYEPFAKDPFGFDDFNDFASFLRQSRRSRVNQEKPAPPPGGQWRRLKLTASSQPCHGCSRRIMPGEKAYVLRDLGQVWCGNH